MAIDMYEDLLKNDENAKQEALLCGIGRVYLQVIHYFLCKTWRSVWCNSNRNYEDVSLNQFLKPAT